MEHEYELLLEKSRERNDFIKRQMKYLGKFNMKNFDHVVADFHEEAFALIDCLKCGNCCRTIGPKMNEPDIKRACKAFGLDQKRFVAESLVRDEDLGWMVAVMPCPFLRDDNACDIYDVRPRDCDDFPYTRERGIQRALGRLAFNTEFCPAAYLIAEKIIERYAPGITK
ncbi:MAG: YkgJ family cysteine cluster protein [Spirochaetes bacterium]|nr:YkgJ family cysteine cluster protein [Spirochaetota bacterium]MBU1080785.1 YkgJ family cysteine cluster protein [Spirochaetota bacterium]